MAKKRTLNELRQTKEYYVAKQKVLSDGGFDTNEEMKQIAACVKEIEEIDPVQKVLAQQIDEELKEGVKEMVDKHQEALDKAGAEGSKEYWPDELEVAKEAIINKITRDFSDVIFQMICEEMSKNYLFQSQNYFTDAGYDQFEDEWFEFYHEHHGDILYEVMKNLFNQPNITN